MSKMKSRNDEPAIQQKEYSQEEYNKKKRKSFRVAKLSCYSAELMAVIGWNLMLSLILFLVLLLGTSALPYIMDVTIDFTPETFWCRGGVFVNLCLVFLVLFTITGFTYLLRPPRDDPEGAHLPVASAGGKVYAVAQVRKR